MQRCELEPVIVNGNTVVVTEQLKEWGYAMFCEKLKQLVEVTPVLTEGVE